MRFATEPLSVALYQSRTQFLSGTGLKTKKFNPDRCIKLLKAVQLLNTFLLFYKKPYFP